MRRLLAAAVCLLGMLPATAMPGEDGGANTPELFSRLAGTSVRVFDARAADRMTRFREFLVTTPMRNGKALPAALIADTTAAVRLYLAAVAADEPVYFVGSYIDKVVTFRAAERRFYAERYAGPVYLQQTCPVFVAAGATSTAQLLGRAANLPRGLFQHAGGSSAELHRLFVLTELSHCGFLAHGLEDPQLRAAIDSAYALRALLESVGDYEATLLFREARPRSARPDEADLLYAARVLGLFLAARAGPYAAVPPMMMLYQAHGLAAGSARLTQAREAVGRARTTFWRLLAAYREIPVSALPLAEMAAIVATGSATEVNELARSLLRQFVVAIEVLGIAPTNAVNTSHDPASWLPGREQPRSRLTLPGSYELAARH